MLIYWDYICLAIWPLTLPHPPNVIWSLPHPQTHTHARTHTNTQTHKYKHTHPPSLPLSLSFRGGGREGGVCVCVFVCVCVSVCVCLGVRQRGVCECVFGGGGEWEKGVCMCVRVWGWAVQMTFGGWGRVKFLSIYSPNIPINKFILYMPAGGRLQMWTLRSTKV